MRSLVRLFVLLLLVLPAGACGERERPVDEPGDRAATAVRTAPSGPRLEPVRRVRGEEVGDFSLAERMAHHGVRVVGVAVVESGEVVERWTRRLDVSRDGDGRLVELDPATLFPGGPLGSPVASALLGFGVVQWAAERGVDLESPFADWVPAPRVGSIGSATVAEVLGHSAGLAETPPPRAASPAEALAALAPGGVLPLADRPGRSHRFAPAGSLLMRALLLRQTGADQVQQAMEGLVLAPWGLDSTWMEGLPPEVAARREVAATEGTETGLWTTPTDLGRWVAGLTVSARGVRRDAPLPWPIARRALEPGPGGWGWGVRLIEPGPRFEVATEEDGDSVLAVGFVSSESGAVVMAVGGERSSWLAREIVLGVAAEHGWPGLEVETLESLPADSVARALAGRYRFAEGELEIRFEDGRLRASAPAGVFGADAIDQTIHPLDPMRYVFLDRPERLDFVRTRGVGVRGLIVGERRAPRVAEAGGEP